jgi:hypothetical protein
MAPLAVPGVDPLATQGSPMPQGEFKLGTNPSGVGITPEAGRRGGVAAHTRKIGLAATLTTSYNERFDAARDFASPDLMSSGRDEHFPHDLDAPFPDLGNRGPFRSDHDADTLRGRPATTRGGGRRVRRAVAFAAGGARQGLTLGRRGAQSRGRRVYSRAS